MSRARRSVVAARSAKSGLIDDLVELCLADQRLLHQVELRCHVLLDGQALDHRGKRRAGVDEDTGLGLVDVRQSATLPQPITQAAQAAQIAGQR